MNLKKLTMLLLPVLGLTALVACNAAKTTQTEALRLRAAGVFKYDQTNLGELSPGKVRALSLALAFHDVRGAQNILKELEGQVGHNF